MAHTVELLSLIEDYPDAFLEPTEAPLAPSSKLTSQTDSSENSELLALMSEFPAAFVEPDHPQVEAKTENSDIQPQATSSVEVPIPVPAGYELAYHQEIKTFGWGTVDVHLRYDSEKLTSLWITVGKSGTEVQSFCEAIARLTNRLLAADTPISELVKELRGIRGGESEGMGPHRFLGLVDLFGKVLQDVPPRMVMQRENSIPVDSIVAPQAAPLELPAEVVTSEPSALVSVSSEIHQWVELSDTSAIASVCPECGAELQQVNGCSGGACVVCGFSSCS